MTISGWLFLALSWGAVLCLTSYTLFKVFTTK